MQRGNEEGREKNMDVVIIFPSILFPHPDKEKSEVMAT